MKCRMLISRRLNRQTVRNTHSPIFSTRQCGRTFSGIAGASFLPAIPAAPPNISSPRNPSVDFSSNTTGKYQGTPCGMAWPNRKVGAIRAGAS